MHGTRIRFFGRRLWITYAIRISTRFVAHLLPAPEQLLDRAKAIEKAVYTEHGSTNASYKAKIRTLFVNLKDKNNPSLRGNVVSGELPVERFTKMTSQVSRLMSREKAGAET